MDKLDFEAIARREGPKADIKVSTVDGQSHTGRIVPSDNYVIVITGNGVYFVAYDHITVVQVTGLSKQDVDNG